MKLKLLLIFLFFPFLFFDCEKENTIDQLLGTWVVVSYTDNLNNTIIEKQDVESLGMDVILNLKNGSFCGINTTNSIFGNFTINHDSISVTNYGGTKVGQPQWGNMFSDIVRDLETFNIEDKTLIFNYNNNRNSIILKP